MIKAPPSVAFLQPLLARAAEIAPVDPIVAYFCYYWAAQQVIDTKRYTSDPEVTEFASSVLNEIEAMKSSGGVLDNEDARDILESDDASRAHVLNFANSVFDRAEAATKLQKVTVSTGSGFAAAAIFLGLDAVWEPLDADSLEKIKFAKFQAARILKAIKNKVDPNTLFEATPSTEEGNTEEALPESEAESKTLSSTFSESSKPLHSTTAPENAGYSASEFDIDPKVPETTRDNQQSDFSLPVASRSLETESGSPASWPNNVSQPSKSEPKPDNEPVTVPKPVSKPVPAVKPARASQQNQTESPQPASNAPVNKPQTPAASSMESTLSTAEILNLTKTTADAQKHARYAISALNYDDIPTAISQLENALERLRLYQSRQA